MQPWGIVGERRVEGVEHGELLVFDVDQTQRRLRGGDVDRGDRGHRLAREPNPVEGDRPDDP